MRRRRFLAALATAPALATAGCSGSSGGPDAVAEAFITAFYNGDLGTLRELSHPSGPVAENLSSGVFVPPDAELQDVESSVIEEGDETATAEASYEVHEFGSESYTETLTAELREYDGNWHVWTVEFDT